jgi:spore germination protein KA
MTNSFILDYLSKRSLIKNEIFSSLKNDLVNYIPSISFIEINEKNVMEYLFNGFTIIIFGDEIIAIETKALLDRSISEPTSEPTIKGPKDAFNENYNTNIGLIRKRIKSENLYIKELTIGTVTKTKVSIMYLDNIVDKDLLNNVINKIKNIKTDKILDSYYIKELIKGENKTIIPTIKSTEKPDTISKCLTEGKICILTENSSNVLIIPTFFIEYFYNTEDNYQKKIYVEFVKFIRMLALFITIFAPAIYLSLITYDQQMLPTNLLINFSLQRSGVPFPALIEAFLLMITFELLYEADALTPTTRGTSLSILGALVLGDAAVAAGIVSPIMVIVVAITAISSIFFAFQDFQSSIRLYRYGLMILSCFFGMIGILFGFLFLLTKLCSIKSFNKPFIISFDTFKSKNNLIKHGLLKQNTDKGSKE